MNFLTNKKLLIGAVVVFAVYWFFIRKKMPVAGALSQAPSASISSTTK